MKGCSPHPLPPDRQAFGSGRSQVGSEIRSLQLLQITNKWISPIMSDIKMDGSPLWPSFILLSSRPRLEMKSLLIFAGLLVAAAAVSYEDVLFQEWNLYKAEFKKSYDNPLDNFRRMEIFLDNKYEVAQHNLRYRNGEETYEMEINEFSDWLPEEIAAMNGFNKDLRDRAEAGEEVVFPEHEGEVYEIPSNNDAAPASVNWVEKGVVAPVKNQGSCGSCYAFSALGALESQQYMATKKMVRLSEQNIVDCSGKFGNMGCNGGNAGNTFNYVKANGGVDTEASYPYEGKQGKCRFDKSKVGATCDGYVKVSVSEEALKNAVANIGPIAVSVHTLDSFLKYKSGVYNEPKCRSDVSSLNHAVLLVGYGTDASTKQDYWLIKNSWGTSWGERGYIRLARNKNNLCGVATYALYPKLGRF